ncbi:MAG: hypothetical protein CMP84_15140 [Gammaproteobacteria bacterium]|nr:hypothetical protein [Gammaproteobacteria bacterium]
MPVTRELQPFLEEYCRIDETESSLDVFDSLIDAHRWLLQDQKAHRKQDGAEAAPPLKQAVF